MLYVANFSYSTYDDEFENACLMPAVVDAPDYGTAVERFQALLHRFHDESPLMGDAESVYLDSIVELTETPTEPVIVQWQKIVASDEGLYSDVVPLPGGDEHARVCDAPGSDEDVEAERVALVDEDEAEDEGLGDADDDELNPEDLAEAITQALDFLFGDDLVDLATDVLDGDAEPFLTFED